MRSALLSSRSDMTDVSRLFQHAFSGRAVLLAGQELEPGTTLLLRRLLAKDADIATDASLIDICANISDPAQISTAIRSVSATGSRTGLRRVAEVPWAGVFTSAVDDNLSNELASQDSQGRRLRHLSVDDEMPAFFSRRNDVLTVVHLAHLANEQTTDWVAAVWSPVWESPKILDTGYNAGFATSSRSGPSPVHCWNRR